MIIEFSLGNYRSFNGIQTINFRATGLKSDDEAVDANNVVEVDGQRLLKTIGVYGANASGKSNLVKGLIFFKVMVTSSIENKEYLANFINPYRQKKQTDEAGFFQIVIQLNGKKYRYGFRLKRNLHVIGEEEIESEWLFGPAEKNETFYFKRLGKEIEINVLNFSEGQNIPYASKLRPNALFLSFCSSYNGETSNAIINFISNINNPDLAYYNTETNSLIKQGKKELVLKWLEDAGLIFNNIEVRKSSDNFLEDVLLYKNVYDENGKTINSAQMNLRNDESDGTRKYYQFIGKLHEKFEHGGLFVPDEIDSNFHPLLLQKIMKLFNNPIINKANAQLLFTSHDTNLMDPSIMRRDQFYFTEKSLTDETILYSLSDLKGIRNNADFAKQYLIGYYGALPVLGNYIEESHTIENPEK